MMTETVREDRAGGGASTLFAGPGEMRARCRAFDWATTPLGAVEHWPQSLRTATGLALGSGFPMVVLWGPELIQLYNDAYVPFLAAKHPGGLGISNRDCWPEAWHVNEPIYARALAGETVSFEDALYRVHRHGPDRLDDDLYITLSYSPIPNEGGGVGGVLVTLLDTTAQVLGRRAEAERTRLVEALQGERIRLLEEVFRRAPSFMHVLCGPDFVVEFVNDAYY